MTDTPTSDPGDRRTPEGRPSRARRGASAVALVAGGLLAGGILTSGLTATADVVDPGSETGSETETSATDCGPRGPFAALDAETAAQVEEAVLAEYPGATVRGAREDPDGGYHAHVITADDEHLLVTLDEDFAITGEVERSEMRRGGPRGFGHGAPRERSQESTEESATQTSGSTV